MQGEADKASVSLAVQQDADIARRAPPAIWSSLAGVQFALLAGSYSKDHLLPIELFAFITTAACIGRLLLVIRKKDFYRGSPARWRALFCSCQFAFSLAWGLLSAYAYVTYGYLNWNSSLLTFCVLGLSAGALVS